MVNCLSKRKFSNLLFLDLRVAGGDITALFDTGAGMTVITRSAAERLGARMEQATLPAGNNSGLVRRLQTAVLSDVRLGDIPAGELRVVMTDDADLDLRDEIGAAFPAQMLLWWDVISRYRWSYSAKEETLSVGRSETPSAPTDPDSRLGPVVFPSYAGRPFPARVDTGHTSSTLSGAWRARLPNVDWHEAEIVGVGSARRQSVPYARELPPATRVAMVTAAVPVGPVRAGAPAPLPGPPDLPAGRGYQRDAVRSAAGDRGPAGIRFPGGRRLAAGPGIPTVRRTNFVSMEAAMRYTGTLTAVRDTAAGRRSRPHQAPRSRKEVAR